MLARAPLKVVELAEWQRLPFEDLELGDSDRLLAARLSGNGDGRLLIEEMKKGIRISATSWVGVVRFSQFELRVVPKLAGGNVGLVEMIEFTSGLSALRRNSGARTLDASGAGLFDLLALLLAEHCERLLQDGLLADYVEHEDDLPAVRGRLLADQQILRRFGRVDRVICRFDEHEQDILENRLLSAALRLAADRVTHESVRHRVRGLRGIFDAICDPISLDISLAREQIAYTRQNEHYRDAHDLAYLILSGLGADDLYAPGDVRCFAFLLDMNQLFERFVYRLIQTCLVGTGMRVWYQHSDNSIISDAATGAPYMKVIPDLLIEGSGNTAGRLAVDAKYKLYSDRRLSSGDVYQTFLYAYAYGGVAVDSAPVSLLIYPTPGSAICSQRLRVRGGAVAASAEIVAIGLPITGALAEASRGQQGLVMTHLRSLVATQLEQAH
jgi:5-methylcytosine-specific restriction enzyme subunit McrC